MFKILANKICKDCGTHVRKVQYGELNIRVKTVIVTAAKIVNQIKQQQEQKQYIYWNIKQVFLNQCCRDQTKQFHSRFMRLRYFYITLNVLLFVVLQKVRIFFFQKDCQS